MKTSLFNIQRLAYFLVAGFLLVYFLNVAQVILSPLAFAVLFAFLFYPICVFFERFIKWRTIAILLTFITVMIPLTAIGVFFAFQVVNIFDDISSIIGNFKDAANTAFGWLEQNLGLTKAESIDWLKDNFSSVLDAPLSFFKKGISASTTSLVGYALMLIYLFFLLLYRTGIKNFILIQFGKATRKRVSLLIDDIRKTLGRYLFGLLLVILILAVLNSIGLWVIGIEHAIFWACLAAALNIIPYIGTSLGALLPFVYSLTTFDHWWQPLAVLGWYGLVQALEGNFITPNVVGSSVKINPMMAILSIIIGGAIWGIAGVILALPVTAMIKLILDQIDRFKPVGLLMSDELHSKQDKFLEEWDDEQYSILKYFENE